MKNKLFNKFFFTTMFIILFSLAIMFIIMSFLLFDFSAKETRTSLVENCNAVASILDSDVNFESDQKVVALIKALSSSSGSEIFIADSLGNVKLCTCSNWESSGVCLHNERWIGKDFLNHATEQEYFSATTLGGILPEQVFCAATAVKSDETVFAYVFTISPMNNVKAFNMNVFRIFALSAIIPLVLLFVAEYLQVYTIRKPLKSMSEAARCVSRGDYSRRIPVISDDEIGELCVAFNQMTNSLVRLEGMRRSFIANISHELKTPMTTISGFIDGIMDGTISPDRQQHYLQIVSDEVHRLSRLVQAMLSLSKLESGETKINTQRFDLSDVVMNILFAQEQRISAKNISICGLDTMEPVIVNADKDLIHQVVYNLVDNAVKFTHDNGTITLDTAVTEEGARFSIRNTGDGIPNDALPYVFDRFYKIDRSRSANKDSTGLGLHIAKTIIGVHSGRISVSSVYGSYAEFSFVLPLNF